MTLKNSVHKIDPHKFHAQAQYLGIAVGSGETMKIKDYVDLESFFLTSTYNMNSARMTEGLLCWLQRYGHLLSPSKVRRLIKSKTSYSPAVLGGLISYMEELKVNQNQIKILKPFAVNEPAPVHLLKGPAPKNKNPHFLKYNIIAHNFRLQDRKFLRPLSYVYQHCTELRNRALFGSSVNADVASYLHWHPDATPYQIAKATKNHKASVFKVYGDVKLAM